VIGWVWQFTLQSAQRHNQISKIGDIFEKISTVQSAQRHNQISKIGDIFEKISTVNQLM
jgi:hypothetical protein